MLYERIMLQKKYFFLSFFFDMFKYVNWNALSSSSEARLKGKVELKMKSPKERSKQKQTISTKERRESGRWNSLRKTQS